VALAVPVAGAVSDAVAVAALVTLPDSEAGVVADAETTVGPEENVAVDDIVMPGVIEAEVPRDFV
jgi:hypothetical protein